MGASSPPGASAWRRLRCSARRLGPRSHDASVGRFFFFGDRGQVGKDGKGSFMGIGGLDVSFLNNVLWQFKEGFMQISWRFYGVLMWI